MQNDLLSIWLVSKEDIARPKPHSVYFNDKTQGFRLPESCDLPRRQGRRSLDKPDNRRKCLLNSSCAYDELPPAVLLRTELECKVFVDARKSVPEIVEDTILVFFEVAQSIGIADEPSPKLLFS
ncbi:MAG TPA: hypothetical protein VFW40_02245 [Capsulimonadaceae bacterium]|nr:hypothetical protein [Capsulimonadaceae bacterium]